MRLADERQLLADEMAVLKADRAQLATSTQQARERLVCKSVEYEALCQVATQFEARPATCPPA
jgi:chorismate mutase